MVNNENNVNATPNTVPNPTERNLNDDQIKELINKAKNDRNVRLSLADGIHSTVTRNFIIVGTGDGGCNIAQAIMNACPGCILYCLQYFYPWYDQVKS